MVIIPILALLSLTGAAVLRAKRPKAITPERQRIYESALTTVKDSGKLRELAGEYERAGLRGHADMLRKRAALRDAPPAVTAQRRAVFKRAITSVNPTAVREVAAVFAGEGALGAADTLRRYADSIIPAVLTAPLPPEDEEVDDDDTDESEPADDDDADEEVEDESEPADDDDTDEEAEDESEPADDGDAGEEDGALIAPESADETPPTTA